MYMFYDYVFVLYCTANPAFGCKNPINDDDDDDDDARLENYTKVISNRAPLRTLFGDLPQTPHRLVGEFTYF